MNPFLLNYKKAEDRVTNLFMHVLTKCSLVNPFLEHVYEVDSFKNSIFSTGLQMHNEFTLPVKKAYILSISNTGNIANNRITNEKEEGNPDAYFYDIQNQTLVFIEVKIGRGVLHQDQLERHKSKVKSFPSDQWIHQTISWSWIRDFLKMKLKANCSELENYVINNFIGVINDEIIGANYDKDYFLWLSDNYRNLIKNISWFLSTLNINYEIELPYGNHNEVRYLIGNTRFVTFVLNKDRFILHPGGKKGLNWRRIIYENYGVIYDQGDKYPNELCIPFTSINEATLTIKPNKNNYILDDFYDLRKIIVMTLKENRKIKSQINNIELGSLLSHR